MNTLFYEYTNNVFTLRACSRVGAATPSHRGWSFRFATLLAYATWAASAAKGKGSAGPVRRRRENETLGEIQRGLIRTGKYKMVDLIQNSMIE